MLACGKKDSTKSTGPIDGSYKLSQWTCASYDLYAFVAEAFIMGFSDTSATLKFVRPSCTQVESMTASYPSAHSVAMVEGPTTCSPTGCSSCTPSSAPNPAVTDTYNYVLSGSTLTLTRTLTTEIVTPTSVYSGNCSIGDTETMVLTKQ